MRHEEKSSMKPVPLSAPARLGDEDLAAASGGYRWHPPTPGPLAFESRYVSRFDWVTLNPQPLPPFQARAGLWSF